MEDPPESYVIRTILNAEDLSHGDPACPGDDGVLVGDDQIVAMDTMVEGVHFDDRISPEDLGWKLVAVNVSDLGAMGARPDWALLSVSLPKPLDRDWVVAFSRGLHQALDRWALRLVGGDTTATPGPVMVSLAVSGRAERPVTRGGARPRDQLWVTGALGEASAEFHDIAATGWWRRPEPPVEFGVAAAEQDLVTAMMDLSDGLSTDLPRLCASSKVGARVERLALPIASVLEGREDALSHAVAFGEDYELLLTAAPASHDALIALARRHHVTLRCIGAITDDREVHLDGGWPAPRFSHFGGSA